MACDYGLAPRAGIGQALAPMARKGEHPRDWRRIALMLALCALVARIAVPSGWMPEYRANGVTLAWCSGLSQAAPAEARAQIDAALGKPAKPDSKGAQGACGFAAAGHAMAALDLAPVLPPPLPASLDAPIVPEASPGRGLAAPPPFATGPPLHA